MAKCEAFDEETKWQCAEECVHHLDYDDFWLCERHYQLWKQGIQLKSAFGLTDEAIIKYLGGTLAGLGLAFAVGYSKPNLPTKIIYRLRYMLPF